MVGIVVIVISVSLVVAIGVGDGVIRMVALRRLEVEAIIRVVVQDIREGVCLFRDWGDKLGRARAFNKTKNVIVRDGHFFVYTGLLFYTTGECVTIVILILVKLHQTTMYQCK